MEVLCSSAPTLSARQLYFSRAKFGAVEAKTMRSATSLRGLNSAMYNNKNGGDRPKHHLSLPARATHDQGSTVRGDGAIPGGSSFRGAGGEHRRVISEMTSHRDAPMIPRDATPTSVGGGGGGGASRATASAEGERNSGYRAGDEELPIEVQGRYERMRVLGRGSFGAVTLVKDNHDSKLYAMKTLNVGDRPNERTTALSEARLLRWLKHPCILSLFDTFLSADGRLVCLTTTYCDSGDLAKIVRHAAKTKSPLGEKTVLGWFAQLCMGVHHLHEEKKVLHRDIKPNNVFLMDHKRVIQLGDFGLAKVINDPDKQVKAEVGTPYYTSPEMCNNQPYGFPSDVWSLGIVLFELLALDVPFRSRDVVVLVSQVIKAPPPSLPDTYSGEATALARWMLQKDPLRRPTLTQVLSCQPLRRHMTSFVKNYRPMNVPERQRRHDMKHLEAQLASIIEEGGDDPKIPKDINVGCGTELMGEKENAAVVEARSPQTEARQSGVEQAEIGEGADGAAGEEGVSGGAAASNSCGKIEGLSTLGKTREGASVPLKTDVNGVTEACSRGGVGGENAGIGEASGGGRSTPLGRRFGSPQHSKGGRNVMSWATRGAVPVDDEETSEEDRGRRGRSSNDGGHRDRRSRSNENGAGALDFRLAPGGSVEDSPRDQDLKDHGGASAGDAMDEQCKHGGSDDSPRGQDCEDHGGATAGDAVDEQSEFGGSSVRKHSRDVALESLDGENEVGLGITESENNNVGVDLDDHPAAAHEATRPHSPRSWSSARCTLTSRSSGDRATDSVPNEDISVVKEGCEYAVAISESNRRGESSMNACEEVVQLRHPDDPGGTSVAEPTRLASPTVSAPEASVQARHVCEEARGRSLCSDTEREIIARQKEGSIAIAAAVGVGSVLSIGDTIRSSTAAVDSVASASEAEGHGAPDHAGISLRTLQSPRLSGSLSENFKTAKRLSEALTFAADNLG